MKKWIVFTKPQFAYLERKAKKLGITLADLVRRIIDEYRFKLDADCQAEEEPALPNDKK